jgi:hypothetical protein
MSSVKFEQYLLTYSRNKNQTLFEYTFNNARTIFLNIFSTVLKFTAPGRHCPERLIAAAYSTGLLMSFKKFSTTHSAPIKDKPAVGQKSAPVDQPPAPASKAPIAPKPASKA